MRLKVDENVHPAARLRSQARESVLAAVDRLEPMLRGKGPHGRLWIVTETDVRIRGGE